MVISSPSSASSGAPIGNWRTCACQLSSPSRTATTSTRPWPADDGDQVAVASTQGQVALIQASTGQDVWRIKLDKSTLRPVTHALLPEICGGLATTCLDIQEDSAEAKRCDFKVGAEIGIKNVKVRRHTAKSLIGTIAKSDGELCRLFLKMP